MKLINPRGRVVEVSEQDVPDLLKRGFVHVPSDQPEMKYSQVHDRGVSYQPDDRKGVNQQKVFTPQLEDELEVEEV